MGNTHGVLNGALNSFEQGASAPASQLCSLTSLSTGLDNFSEGWILALLLQACGCAIVGCFEGEVRFHLYASALSMVTGHLCLTLKVICH